MPGLANAANPVTMYKKDAYQGLGCTQMNLYGSSQAEYFEKQGFKKGTCNGQGYGRPAGRVGMLLRSLFCLGFKLKI